MKDGKVTDRRRQCKGKGVTATYKSLMNDSEAARSIRKKEWTCREARLGGSVGWPGGVRG